MNKPETINIDMEPNKIGGGSDKNANNSFEARKREIEREAAKHAAQSALSSAGSAATRGAVELKTYVVENPASLKVICFITGLLLLTFSIIGLVNVTNLVTPIDYIITIFNLIFAIIIVIIEGKADWSFFGLRDKIFSNLGLLTYPRGRSLYYFYVGVMVLGILPDQEFWKILYILMGSALALCGILQIVRDCCWHEPETGHAPLPESGSGV